MQNRLVHDIDNYISYLNKQGLYVSVHGKIIGGLLEHNVHKNPYCSFIKTNREAWEQCIKCQQKVFREYNGDYLFGMCKAGVEEYVFYVDSKTFVSVSGYGIENQKAAKRIESISRKFGFNKSELRNIYKYALKHKEEDVDELKTKIMPLCHMLSLLQLSVSDIPKVDTKNKTFESVLSFIQRNSNKGITVKDIANACSCCESTVSHLFKEYMNQSVKKYVNSLRLKQAEKFLATSDLPIENVAEICGFANYNYFSTAFKRTFGLSPREYRKSKVYSDTAKK